MHIIILNEGQETVYLVLASSHFNGQGVPRDIHNVGAQYLAELNDFMPRGGIYANAGQYRFPVHIVRIAEILSLIHISGVCTMAVSIPPMRGK